jgi:hypothetical protein
VPLRDRGAVHHADDEPVRHRAGELQKILKDAAEVEPLLRRVAHHEVLTTAPLADVVAEVLRIAPSSDRTPHRLPTSQR